MGKPKRPTIVFDRLSDLLERLGDIPPKRIRLRPPPGTAIEEDVIRAKVRYNCQCELIAGTLVEKTVGYYESRIAGVLGCFLESYLTKEKLGITMGQGGMFWVAPGHVRIPDMSYYSWSHFPHHFLPPGDILNAFPDLAAEILSPDNTEQEMECKRKEYFAGGTRLVWEIDPLDKTAHVYAAPDESKLIQENESLEGGDVLPGFKLSLADLFERVRLRSSE